MSRQITDEQLNKALQALDAISIGVITKISEDNDRLRAENRRLNEIVERLPMTVDGVVITPGMMLWGSLGWNDHPARATLRGSFTEGLSVYAPEWGMNIRPEVEAYSTREAAEKASQ